MESDPRTEPLKQWNTLARENTENAIVSSMLEAVEKASKPVDTFSTWLLVGSAATASFLITNAEKVIPVIRVLGFGVCGFFLCLSCILGLISKIFAVLCQVEAEILDATRNTFIEHYSAYVAEEKKF